MSLRDQIDSLATRIANHFRDAVIPRLIPNGGTAGQVLKKSSNTDYAVSWENEAGGESLAAPTSDGADNSLLYMAGGGAPSSSRGGFVVAYGNEHATSPGDVIISAGSSGSVTLAGSVEFSDKATARTNLGMHVGMIAPASPVLNDVWIDTN